MAVRCRPALSEKQFLSGCFVCIQWIPRVAVPLAIAWGTLSHVAYSSAIGSRVARIVLLALGAAAGALAFVAYYAVWRIGPGTPLVFPEFVVDADVADAEEHAPLVLQRAVEAKRDGGIRFCSKCRCFKPDRTHHCRHCGMCVLRMDHHCPWFSACVGFHNHKFFVQFLWYVCALCGAASAVAVPRAYFYFHNEQYLTDFIGINFALYMVLALAFFIILTAFASYTTWLVVTNRTTLETMEPQAYRTSLPAQQWRYRRPPDSQTLGNLYDVGPSANTAQLMGTTWTEWLLPVRPRLRLNGTHFPVNDELAAKAEERAQTEIALHVRKQQWLQAQAQESQASS